MPSEDTRNIKRNERVRKIKRRRRIRIFAALTVLALIVVGVLSITVLFPVNEITAEDSEYYSAEEIINASGINNGDNVIMAGRKNGEKRICTALPYIKKVKFVRSLKGNIKIKATYTLDKYAVVSDGKYFVTDSDMKILRTEDKKADGLTYIYLNGKIKGETGAILKSDDETDEPLLDEVISLLDEKKMYYDVIDISKSYNITVRIDQRFIVEFGSRANLSEKCAHLSMMLTKIDEKKCGLIDLSSWTQTNSEASFRERDISSYYQ